MDKPWFRRWFNDAYLKLYPHRNLEQAEAQVALLRRALPIAPDWRILDVGCGSGRHLEALRRAGCERIVGFDLSMSLLRETRRKGLSAARGDMRRLPFRGGYHLVTCFFTSFGYFATFEEDVGALGQFASMLRPGGHLFLDLINQAHLAKTLVPHDRRSEGDAEVEQWRRLEGNVVVKEIEIRRPGKPPERFEERVRLYGHEEIVGVAARFGLVHGATFGDENGGPWHPESSPRMSLLFGSAPP